MAEQSIADYIQQNLAPKEQRINDFLASTAKTVASPAPQSLTPPVKQQSQPGMPAPNLISPNYLDPKAAGDVVGQQIQAYMAQGLNPSNITGDEVWKTTTGITDKLLGANVERNTQAWKDANDVVKKQFDAQLDLWKKQQEQQIVNRPNPDQTNELHKYETIANFADKASNQWDATQKDVSTHPWIPYGNAWRSGVVGGLGTGVFQGPALAMSRVLSAPVKAYEDTKDAYGRINAPTMNVTTGQDARPTIAASLHNLFPGAEDNNLSGSQKIYGVYDQMLSEAKANKDALDRSHVSSDGWDNVIKQLEKGQSNVVSKYFPIWKANNSFPFSSTGPQNTSTQPPGSNQPQASNSGLSTQTQQLIRQQAQQGVAPNGQ